MKDNINQDTAWNSISTSYNPLILLKLIEKTILAQIEDQYLFATIYNQELILYNFCQDSMSNPQWYEHFNTNFDVSESILVTLQHKALLQYVAQETHSLNFDAFVEEHQASVRIYAKDLFLSYSPIRQSKTQHIKLKMDL